MQVPWQFLKLHAASQVSQANVFLTINVSFIYRLPLKTRSALHYWTNIAENNVTRIAIHASRPEMIYAKPTSIPPLYCLIYADISLWIFKVMSVLISCWKSNAACTLQRTTGSCYSAHTKLTYRASIQQLHLQEFNSRGLLWGVDGMTLTNNPLKLCQEIEFKHCNLITAFPYLSNVWHLEVPKVMDGALGSLTWWGALSPWQGLELNDL